jgi:hypothetical protein
VAVVSNNVASARAVEEMILRSSNSFYRQAMRFNTRATNARSTNNVRNSTITIPDESVMNGAPD